MRIIDKNTDFYDYLQNIYRDSTFTFDRTDSFILTKEDMCRLLYSGRHEKVRFVVIQSCNTFWLFMLEVTYNDNVSMYPVDYTVMLLSSWKNYNKSRELLKADVVEFGFNTMLKLDKYNWKRMRREHDPSSIIENVPVLTNAFDSGDFKYDGSMNRHTVYYGDGHKEEKHIPILKASRFSQHIDPLEIYQSIEEYFSLEKQASERTDSVGLTDIEKAENHGFDKKISFRGN